MLGKLSAVVLGALLLSSCAPQLDRIEVGVQKNSTEVAQLRAELAQLRQEMQVINDLLRIGQDAGVETEAQRLAKLGQLSLKLDQLMQMLQDNAEYMRDVSARVDLLATRAGIPTLGPYKTPAATASSSEPAPLPEEGRAIFQAAELDRSRGNIELAREGFQDFLSKYDGTELADDAIYWLGDLAYGEENYEEALQYFLVLLERHPQSERSAASMLKTAYCLQALNRPVESRAMFERLIARHPDAAEAALAREELSR